VDPYDFDYKSAWKVFWMDRMEEILKENIEKKKTMLREKLELPEGYEEPSRSDKKRSLSPIAYCDISSDDSTSDDYHYQPKRRFPQKSPVRRFMATSSPAHSPNTSLEYNESVSFVSVCRLLAALETELGSLAPKILELLSQSLAMERILPNSSDTELMTSENLLLLETVKEKMKGLLIANLVPSPKVAAIKTSVQNIAKLIHQTPVKILEPSETTKEDKEKVELAGKIAKALKAHGKEDCTPEELEVLVEIFLEHEDSETEESPPEPEKIGTNFEILSYDELEILVRNFSDLDTDEQNQLIKFLSELEKNDPEKVDSLRKFVDVTEEKAVEVVDDDDPEDYNIAEAVKNVVAHVGITTNLTDNLLNIRAMRR
jgi:hypothetical protein